MVRHNRRRRGGFLILVAMVLLAVLFSLCSILLRRLFIMSKHASSALPTLQVEQLAEAGLTAARIKLAADDNYQGELWRPDLPKSDAEGDKPSQTAEVEIVASRVHEDEWRLTSKAKLEDVRTGGVFRVTRAQSLTRNQLKQTQGGVQ